MAWSLCLRLLHFLLSQCSVLLQAHTKQMEWPFLGLSLCSHSRELPGWTRAGQGPELADWAASGAQEEGASVPPMLLDSVSEVCPLKSGAQLPAHLEASQAKATEMGRHRENLRGDVGKECEAAWPFASPASCLRF